MCYHGFISPSETVRKILVHSLKMEFSVIDLSLLNFPARFHSAFLKGLSKSFSCSKQDPNLALYFDVQLCGLLSSVCTGHFSNFILSVKIKMSPLIFNSVSSNLLGVVLLSCTEPAAFSKCPCWHYCSFSLLFALCGRFSPEC